MRIDLNADLGESWPRWESGDDRALLEVVSSANVCCGAYAGDADLMRATCEAAVASGVAIGAQVGYPDREGFGRQAMTLPPGELGAEVTQQIDRLIAMAREVGGEVTYVKPHGALYNAIVTDQVQATDVVGAVAAASRLPILGLPGSAVLTLAVEAGLGAIAEGFADRAYTPDGKLVPRSEPGSVFSDAQQVAVQAVHLLHDGVDSICVHSDSPGALALAHAARSALEFAGATVVAVGT